MTGPENPILSSLGSDPEEVARGLREFLKSAETLSKDRSRLINERQFPWVGVYRGEVSARAHDLPSLMEELERRGIPLGDTIVRFIEKNQRTLILQHAAGKVRRHLRSALHGGTCSALPAGMERQRLVHFRYGSGHVPADAPRRAADGNRLRNVRRRGIGVGNRWGLGEFCRAGISGLHRRRGAIPATQEEATP